MANEAESTKIIFNLLHYKIIDYCIMIYAYATDYRCKINF